MRKILLTLAADATECGACCHATNAPRGSGWFCDVFGEPLDWDGHDTLRLPECLAAEQRAALCVEIEPADAAYMDCACGEPGCTDAIQRVEAALREHGRKA